MNPHPHPDPRMEFHGFVRNEELFDKFQEDYPEWVPARLALMLGAV